MIKGFTLVELLAVIVILAVLALIATPVVLSIIDDAKESAMLRSAEMYLSGVENAVMRENMNSGGNFRPNECTITSEGNIYCDGNEDIIEVEVNGETPNNGNIVFENGKIIEVSLTYESGTIVKDSSGELVYESSKEDTLASGLYDVEGNMTMSWEELTTKEFKYNCGNCETGFHVYDSIINVSQDGELTSRTDCFGDLVFIDDIIIGELILSNNVKSIGSQVFEACKKLISITIPNGVSSIKTLAFSYCSTLETINYTGTKEEWNNITFGSSWNQYCPEITVHCTDGNITISAWEEV